MSDENQEVVDGNEENIENVESPEESQDVEGEVSEDSGEEVQAETPEELQEEMEEAAKNGASKKELQDMVKSFELKVNGKTIHKKLDLNDHEAIKAELQKAYAGQKSMQEKAELEKALVAQVNEWKKDPWKFFEQMNLDPDELAEMRIQQRIEEMKKDPAQLEQEKMQAELQKMREELKAKEEKEKALERERLQEQAAMELDEEISEALDAHGSLPSSPRVIRQIADTMLWAHENADEFGIDPDKISVKDVLPTVEAEIRKEISDLMGALPEQMMEEYIGKKNLERLRKQRMSKAKKVPKTAKSIQKNQSAPAKKKENEPEKPKQSIDDFLRRR